MLSEVLMGRFMPFNERQIRVLRERYRVYVQGNARISIA